MTRLGIIPAGGKAERFRGVMKEMLPCGEVSLLDRCVLAMSMVCDDVMVISTPDKIHIHAHALKDTGASFCIGKDTLKKSLEDVIRKPYDHFVFAMPDTYFPLMIFERKYKADFTLGLFQTDMPSRFGVMHKGQIWDKYFNKGDFLAWGVLAWSRNAADHWLQNKHDYPNHTAAFNGLLNTFEYETFELAYYYDMASYDDYRKLVNDV